MAIFFSASCSSFARSSSLFVFFLVPFPHFSLYFSLCLYNEERHLALCVSDHFLSVLSRGSVLQRQISDLG